MAQPPDSKQVHSRQPLTSDPRLLQHEMNDSRPHSTQHHGSVYPSGYPQAIRGDGMGVNAGVAAVGVNSSGYKQSSTTHRAFTPDTRHPRVHHLNQLPQPTNQTLDSHPTHQPHEVSRSHSHARIGAQGYAPNATQGYQSNSVFEAYPSSVKSAAPSALAPHAHQKEIIKTYHRPQTDVHRKVHPHAYSQTHQAHQAHQEHLQSHYAAVRHPQSHPKVQPRSHHRIDQHRQQPLALYSRDPNPSLNLNPHAPPQRDYGGYALASASSGNASASDERARGRKGAGGFSLSALTAAAKCEYDRHRDHKPTHLGMDLEDQRANQANQSSNQANQAPNARNDGVYHNGYQEFRKTEKTFQHSRDVFNPNPDVDVESNARFEREAEAVLEAGVEHEPELQDDYDYQDENKQYDTNSLNKRSNRRSMPFSTRTSRNDSDSDYEPQGLANRRSRRKKKKVSTRRERGTTSRYKLREMQDPNDQYDEPTRRIDWEGIEKRAPLATDQALEVVDELIQDPQWDVFVEPVTEDIAPDYFSYINHPMDLQTIRQKVSDPNGGVYTVGALWELFFRISANCRIYNKTYRPLYELANEFEDKTRSMLKAICDRAKEANDFERKLVNVMRNLRRHPDSKPFRKIPEDTLDRSVIERPMDISTIDTNIRKGKYRELGSFAADMRLILDNCISSFGKQSTLSALAHSTWRRFMEIIRSSFPSESRSVLMALNARKRTKPKTEADALPREASVSHGEGDDASEKDSNVDGGSKLNSKNIGGTKVDDDSPEEGDAGVLNNGEGGSHDHGQDDNHDNHEDSHVSYHSHEYTDAKSHTGNQPGSRKRKLRSREDAKLLSPRKKPKIEAKNDLEAHWKWGFVTMWCETFGRFVFDDFYFDPRLLEESLLGLETEGDSGFDGGYAGTLTIELLRIYKQDSKGLIDEFTWESELVKQLEAHRIECGLAPTDPNPLASSSFGELSMVDKLCVITWVCEWCLSESDRIRGLVVYDGNQPPYQSEPLGDDGTYVYYHYLPQDRAEVRIYREYAPMPTLKGHKAKKKTAIQLDPPEGYQWKLIATTIDDARALMESLNELNPKTKAKRNQIKKIKNALSVEVIEELERRQRQLQIIERQSKKLGVNIKNILADDQKRRRRSIRVYKEDSSDSD
ncbi:hypothetical protein AAMO2058_001360300 [Amorphochlora amoebiformis]